MSANADRANVVIVGGGIIGCCTAYYLARAGARVTLLERGPLCSEASSANAGLVTMSTRDGLLFDLARESVRLMAQAQQEMEADFELARVGNLFLVRTEAEARQQQALVEKQRQRGVEIQLLDRQATLELEPAASPDILGGVYSPMDCVLNPYAMTLAFGRGARRLGATVRTGVEVAALKAGGGRVRGVTTSRGEDVEGDVVVLAAGAWTPALARSVGLNLPIEPSRGQIVATEPLPPLHRTVVRDCGHIYVRPTGRGNYVIGSQTEKVGFDKGLTVEKLRDYVSEAVELVPGLRGVKVLRAWAGLRPLTPDSQPLLGRVPGYEGLVLAAGHSRTGVAYSTVTSKMVADLIVTGDAGFPMDLFSPTRFAA